MCGGYPILSPISQCLCGWFSLPWILVTAPGMGGVAIKRLEAAAQDWGIPEAWSENFCHAILLAEPRLGPRHPQILCVAFLHPWYEAAAKCSILEDIPTPTFLWWKKRGRCECMVPAWGMVWACPRPCASQCDEWRSPATSYPRWSQCRRNPDLIRIRVNFQWRLAFWQNAQGNNLHCFLGMRCSVTWTFQWPVVFCAGVLVNLCFSKGHKQVLVMADTHLSSTSTVLYTHISHYFPIS